MAFRRVLFLKIYVYKEFDKALSLSPAEVLPSTLEDFYSYLCPHSSSKMAT